MGANESATTTLALRNGICCPKCPLTPIISISMDNNNNVICEYRCPFMHFGQVPFQQIFEDVENKHGTHCDKCQKTEQKDLVYCGTCKQFFCPQCKISHDKEKDSHIVTIPLQKIKYTCLEHGKKFTSYCFTCLVSTCPDCNRHKNHCMKLFKEFAPDKEFIDNYNFYMKDFSNYLKSVGKRKSVNRNLFDSFKNRSYDFYLFAKSLYENYNSGNVNGEIIINLLNVVCFDYHADNINDDGVCIEYFKKHLILSNRPISDICTFSKTKSDYKIKDISFVPVKSYEEIKRNERVKISPFGHVISTCEKIIYFDKAEKDSNFKIEMSENINFFNIINKNILCICAGTKIYFYELQNTAPFYFEYDKIKYLDKFTLPVLDIIGDINANLYVRTKDELLLVKRKVEGSNDLFIFNKEELKDNNTIVEEEIDDPNQEDRDRFDFDYMYNRNRNRNRNRIKIKKTVKTELCAIINNYLVSLESGVITLRNMETLKIIHKLESRKHCNFKIFNGQIMVIDQKDIIFYSVPDFEIISKLTTAEKICSISFPNPKIMILVTEKTLEQYEANTWKRLSRNIGFVIDKENSGEDLIILGAKKELFAYNKKKNTLFKGVKLN